jgi:hypothetical protein
MDLKAATDAVAKGKIGILDGIEPRFSCRPTCKLDTTLTFLTHVILSITQTGTCTAYFFIS